MGGGGDSASRAAASGPRLRTPLAKQVCVPARSAPGPGPVGHQRLGAALPSALPHDVPERSERTHATFAGFGRARRDGNVRRPHRFSSTLCLFPLSSFSIRRNPRDWRRRRLGTPGRSAPSSLTRRFITARPFFSFSLSPLHLKPSPELRREARGEAWLVGTVGRERPSLPSQQLRGREAAQARDLELAWPGRAESHTQRPHPMPPPCATRAGLWARALALRWSRGQRRRKPHS